MTRFRSLAVLGASLLVAATALAGAKKQSAATVRFHAEGGAEGGNFSQPVQLLASGKNIHIQSLPLITEKEIVSFFPFPARDGSGTFGASFRLDNHGRSLLFQHTASRRGTYMVAFFNGRRVIDLFVDRGVTDGIVTIPSGLSAIDISLLDTTFPTMGREKEGPAKPKKEPKPRPAPETADGGSPTPPPRLQPAMARQPDGTLAPARIAGGAPSGDIVPRPLSPVGQ